MRTIVGFMCGAALMAGCAGHSAQSPKAPVPSAEHPIITPDSHPAGSIISINHEAKYVVLRFPFGKVPAAGTLLGVYHDGVKTGSLMVTGPQRADTITAADIASGNISVNDEVNPE
jgi:hypothetical protein